METVGPADREWDQAVGIGLLVDFFLPPPNNRFCMLDELVADPIRDRFDKMCSGMLHAVHLACQPFSKDRPDSSKQEVLEIGQLVTKIFDQLRKWGPHFPTMTDGKKSAVADLLELGFGLGVLLFESTSNIQSSLPPLPEWFLELLRTRVGERESLVSLRNISAFSKNAHEVKARVSILLARLNE